MKAYITFTRKKLFVLILVLLSTVLICNEMYLAGNKQTNALTNANRLNFLKTAGYTVLCDTPTSKSLMLPDVFSDVYGNYNTMQKSVGYDLSFYTGCEVTIYSYSIVAPEGYSGECIANMIVYNNRIIGGDVSSATLGGFILPLRFCE